jgi:DNA-binding CsgD family transcriptional regulator
MSTLGVPEELHPCCCHSIHLTEREIQVLSFLASGKTSSEIALQLGLSRRTVDSHVATMLRKAAVRNRCELLAVVVAHGVIDLSAGAPRWTGRSCLPVSLPPAPAAGHLATARPAAARASRAAIMIVGDET